MARPFRKKLNPRLVEKISCYTVDDLAELFKMHRQSVFRWLDNGLKTIDDRRPYMMFGQDIIDWINLNRPTKPKQSDPTKVYCVKCRNHVVFDLEKSWTIKGRTANNFIQSRCPVCNSTVNKISKKPESKNPEAEKG
jgi:hypothetical protein